MAAQTSIHKNKLLLMVLIFWWLHLVDVYMNLALSRVLQLKSIQKLVIDEVDVMLDLGFRHQLINIFDILPERRQNIMFSATMTQDVNLLLNDFFKSPERVSIAVSGTPLENISQQRFIMCLTFHTKVNLLTHLLKDTETYNKVLVFVAYKRMADRLFDNLDERIFMMNCVLYILTKHKITDCEVLSNLEMVITVF